MHNLIPDPAQQVLVNKMDARLADAMKKAGDSWTLKASTGDVELWQPGGPKQRSQNLGHTFPGQAKDSGAPGKLKRKKGCKSVEDEE